MLLPWHSDAFREICRSLEGGAHALLLSGPEGTGKRVLAEHVAQWRLCNAPLPEGACGTCDSCHLMLAGNHPDRIMLEPRSETQGEEGGKRGEGEEGGTEIPVAKSRAKPSRYIVVDQIRELLAKLELASHGSAGRVIVIDPADQMNAAAANSLLKTLEEPAPRTIFILVTSAQERLPATVKSRCRRLSLGLPTTQQAESWLVAQGVSDSGQALRLAGGAPLRARELMGTDLMERWNTLMQHPDADTFRRQDWDTTPEALERLCLTLQMLCVDLQRAAAGSTPSYAGAQATALVATARRLPAPAIADFWRELRQVRRLIQHPLNGSLVRDQMLLGFERLFRSA